jgi:hypothetical protein
VKRCAGQIGTSNLHRTIFRRTCARLCHGSGGELKQIQFLIGHASVQTTVLDFLTMIRKRSKKISSLLTFHGVGGNVAAQFTGSTRSERRRQVIVDRQSCPE